MWEGPVDLSEFSNKTTAFALPTAAPTERSVDRDARRRDASCRHSNAPPHMRCYGMRFFYTHILTSRAYQKSTAAGRRMIELRFTVAKAVRVKRRQRRLTQAQLAELIKVSRPMISKIEQARGHAALDVAVHALLALGCTDDEIAAAFNPGLDPGIQRLRERAARRLYPRPTNSPQLPPI